MGTCSDLLLAFRSLAVALEAAVDGVCPRTNTAVGGPAGDCLGLSRAFGGGQG